MGNCEIFVQMTVLFQLIFISVMIWRFLASKNIFLILDCYALVENILDLMVIRELVSKNRDETQNTFTNYFLCQFGGKSFPDLSFQGFLACCIP